MYLPKVDINNNTLDSLRWKRRVAPNTPTLIPRRTFLQQMSDVVSLLLCAMCFKMDALYFHDHIKPLAHGVTALEAIIPKEPIYTRLYHVLQCASASLLTKD